MSLRSYTWQAAVLKSTLPSTTKLVLMTVGHHVTAAGEAACVSTAQLAAEASLSERAVISHLKSVEGEWLATRRHGYGDQRWARNEYLPRLPGDPSLDVKGTERPSVPPAEIVGEGAERGSVPLMRKGTERGDMEGTERRDGHNGFVLDLKPPTPFPDSKAESPEGELEAWFNSEFWKRYPKREAKAQAWRAVRRLKPNAALRRVILEGLARWLAARDALAKANAFVPSLPLPASWLNGRRWEDETESTAGSDVPRGTSYACATCGAHGVVFHGKRWYCRPHDPTRCSPGVSP